MGPQLEPEGRCEVTPEVSASKENGTIPIDSRDKNLKCESNYYSEIGGVMVESQGACRSDVAEVNITGFSNSSGNRLAKAECQETTESSSSFDDTSSASENADNLSESEVVSGCHPDGSSTLRINGSDDVFRKRKLTHHWRSFIRPLMWRCKWVELQIMKLDAQARKYNTKLAEYNQKKHVLLENIEMGGVATKSFPFSSDRPGGRVLRRKKRRRVEETTNAASYMSNHNLFSYYEKRIHTTDATCADEGQGNRGHFNGNDESEHNDEGFWLGSGDGDNSVEEMFRKIEILQSQISNLKSRLDKVKSENPGKFSLVDDLDLVVSSNGLASSARPLGSPPNNTDRMPVGSSDIASQLILQYNMDNMVMPESAVSSHGVVSHLPEMIERRHPSFLGGTCRNIEDDVLIYNERMNAEMNNLDDVAIKHVEEPRAEASTDRTFPTLSVEQDLPADDQPPPKIRSISKLTAPKRRKKRGRRKASW